MTRVAGELVAVPYASPGGAQRRRQQLQQQQGAFDGLTTNQAFFESSRAAAESTDVRRKRLMPFRPWAPRNRPKECQTNVVGRRYGVHASTRGERYKGESQVAFADADPESRQPWRTTNQVFQACAQVTGVVGLANAGIASDVAGRLHKTQGVYGGSK